MGQLRRRFGDTTISRHVIKVSVLIAIIGAGLALLGLTLIGSTLVSRYFWADDGAEAATACAGDSCPQPVRYTIQRLPSPTPTGTATNTPTATLSPTGTPARLGSAVTPTSRLSPTVESLAETLVITGTTESTATAAPASTIVIAADVVADEAYTSTNQVAPPPAPATPEPTPAPACPTESTAQFELIPIEGVPARDHPDAVHGDLNLALRGFIPAAASPELVTYNGNTDGDPPWLPGLFEPNRPARITGVFRVNDWQWDPAMCGGHPRGCPAPPSEQEAWPVTLIALAATPGESVYVPKRGAQIYPGGFVAMVLYAEEQRLTLGYTRRDTVSAGYTVHLEHVCVNPNLLALYRAQLDAEGWNHSGQLPALRNSQTLGTALDHQLGVAVRDVGTFMDPRSQKDWWR